MNNEHRKNVAVRLCYNVTSDNVAKIYLNNFNEYLYQNSDEVEINGIVIGNSIEDKMMKIKMRFPDKNGNPNIQTAKACGTRAGFPLTELDFIDNQLTILKDLSFTDFVQRKKYETYLNFIQNKKIQPQPEPKFTNTPQQRNIKNQLQKEINDFSFFLIDVVGNIEDDGKIYENIKQRNNDSIITTENWNDKKLEFFNQRMSNYEDSFSQTEKIELEIENLIKEDFETDKHKILKKRYLDLLNDILNNETQESKIKKIKPQLSINQIALKYVYEYSTITRNNGDQIAKEYGHNSGEKLFQRFTFFSSNANRKAEPNGCTPKLLKNKIDLIKSVIDILPFDKQETAKNDVSKLESIYNDKFR
jgi:hypothetical protein